MGRPEYRRERIREVNGSKNHVRELEQTMGRASESTADGQGTEGRPRFRPARMSVRRWGLGGIDRQTIGIAIHGAPQRTTARPKFACFGKGDKSK